MTTPKSLEEKFELTPVEEEKPILDLTPTVQTTGTEIVEAKSQTEEDPQFDEDFITARENILNVIVKVNEAAEYMSEIAKDKEDAKSFEALNGLYKTILSATAILLDTHHSKAKKKKNSPDDTKNIGDQFNIHNAVFTGTAKDLQQLVQNMRKGKNE
jgi:hypothetical protein